MQITHIGPEVEDPGLVRELNSVEERKGMVDNKAGILKEKDLDIKIILKILGKTDKTLKISQN